MLGKRIILFCLALILGSQSIFSQTSTVSDPTGNWWFGGNVGGTFHNSDVKSQLGLGWGLTIERFIWKNYYSPLAISGRLRYLGSDIQGKDDFLSTNTQFNNALNGTNNPSTDYNSGGEPVVHNFLTESHNLGLEVVLYLNALRKMGINFYVFGGADLMWYKTMTDQLDVNGFRYDYANIDLSNLSTELDGNYETNADGSDGTFNTVFAPAFGLGLGYIFNHTWSVGIEHKITFPFTDVLDGQQWDASNVSTGKNDVFHYTALTLGVGFGGSNFSLSNSTSKATLPPPSIQLVWPSTTNYHSQSCEMNIVANLYNVPRKEDIKVYQGAIELSPLALTFDNVSGRLQVQTQISQATTFRIVTTTKAGVAEKTFTITCGEKEKKEEIIEVVPTQPKTTLPPPVIQLEYPKTKTIEVSDCEINVVAYLPNTQGKSYITIIENDRVLPSHAYYYSVANSKLTFNKEFTGKATLIIKVSNGIEEISETLVYECLEKVPPVTIQGEKPEIIILKPTENPHRTLECEVEVMAEVINIEHKDQIAIRQNGNLLSSGEYIYDPGTKILKTLRPIQKYTRLEILASNTFGEDHEMLRLQCEPPVYEPPVTAIPKPFISMQSSYANPAFLSECKANFNLNVFNINSKGDISVLMDGRTLSTSFYSYNTSSRTLNITTPFDNRAEFVITARNTGGVSSYTQVVECKKTPAVAKPTLRILSPNMSTNNVEDCHATIEASIVGVKDKSGIVVRQEGKVVAAHLYSYNAASKEFFLQKPFEGTTSFNITAKNTTGSVSEMVTFNCIEKTPPTPIMLKPTIKIVEPKVESFASEDCSERVYGNIEQIDYKSNITVLANDRSIPFNFNETTKRFSVDVAVIGTTELKIIAKNDKGEVSRRFVMTCEEPLLEPSVKIISPIDNPHIVKDCKVTLIAQTQNVQSKNQIEVTEDGKLIHFDFNPSTGLIEVKKAIDESLVTFEIDVETAGGAALAKRQVKCEKPVVIIPKPTVTIITPTENPHTVADCQLHFKASVQHAEKNDISVSVNKQPVAFDYDAANKIISLKESFEGTVEVEVWAKNESGTTTAKRTLVCKPLVQKPVVKILEPATSPFNTKLCDVKIVATVLNVNEKSDIAVSSNGKDMLFSYNPENKTVSTTLFDVGETKVQIKAQNESGFAQDEIIIICTPPPPKPVVKIISPTTAMVKQEVCQAKVEATITPAEVDDLRINFGGIVLTSSAYTYNKNNGKLVIDRPYEEEVSITITATNETGIGTAGVEFSCAKQEKPMPLPEVKVLSPETNIAVDCQVNFIASVLHVTEKADIKLYENGQLVAATNYEFKNNTVNYNKSFNGEVTIKLTVANASGEKTVSKSIICQPPIPKPSVAITAPLQNPMNITECETVIKATVLEVEKKAQISVTENGAPMVFDFNADTKQVIINHKGKGRYEYVIKVSNESGSAQAIQTIVCTPPAPEITFINPIENPFITDNCNFEVKATVLNVSDKSDIKVKVDGQPVNFIYNASNNIVEFPLEKVGESEITIAATTVAGNAAAARTVKCTPPLPKPLVTITSPGQNPFQTENCNVKVQARVEHVTTKEQITVTRDGTPITFSFNPSTGNVVIQEEVDGEESIVIEAKNEQGEAVATRKIKCVIPSPQITITAPDQNPYNTKDCSAEVKAQIIGQVQKNEVRIFVNGTEVGQNEFSLTNGQLTFNRAKIEGTENIEIVATNKGGKDSKKITLACVQEQKKITICHYPPGNRDYPEEKTILESEWASFEKLGAVKGACPALPKPVITITDPTNAVTETHHCRASVFAKLDHVLEKSSIVVTINGERYNNFSFSEGNFDINNYEFKGEIEIKITAKNATGETNITRTFKCIDKKITICHYPPGNKDNPQEISISENAWPAHEAHGDTQGACPALQKPVLNIQQPGNHQSGVTGCEIDVKARSYHILEKSSIIVTIDGKNQNFEWDGTNISFFKKAQPGEHQVVITATNASGVAKQAFKYTCPAPKTDVAFGIEGGAVVPKDQYNAEVKVIGCALKSGNTDLPVMVQLNFGGKKIDPFGNYADFNKNANVNDKKQHIWKSPNPISANTAISITAKSFMPNKTSPLYERSSNKDSQFVKVLRNGDAVPNVSGYNGQADAETYLKPYISGNKIKLDKNQAIYLFELGVNDPKSAANDMQDCVIVVTLTPVD